MDYDTPNMRVGQWNLSIQKQVGADWLVSASYLGNATRHLWTTQPLNNCHLPRPRPMHAQWCSIQHVLHNREYQPTSPVLRWKIRWSAGLRLREPDRHRRDASYNGLLLSVQRRAASGVTISGNYTWSHCISDLWQEAAQSTNADQGWSDPNNRRADRGNCVRLRDGSPSPFQLLERGRNAAVFKQCVARGRFGLARIANS